MTSRPPFEEGVPHPSGKGILRHVKEPEATLSEQIHRVHALDHVVGAAPDLDFAWSVSPRPGRAGVMRRP